MKRLILTLLVLLFSCKKEDTNPNVFKFSISKGVPVILTTINGKGGKFLIDTGAQQSFLDSRYASFYNFVTYKSDLDSGGTGVGGNIVIMEVRGFEVKYNDSIITHRFRAANLGKLFDKTGIVGILGSDYFKKNKIIIDYGNNEIRKKK